MSIFIKRGEAIKLLGVSENTFTSLGIPYYEIGKRHKYKIDDIEHWLNGRKRGDKCPSAKGRGRHTTGTTLRSGVLDFEAALKQTTNN